MSTKQLLTFMNNVLTIASSTPEVRTKESPIFKKPKPKSFLNHFHLIPNTGIIKTFLFVH